MDINNVAKTQRVNGFKNNTEAEKYISDNNLKGSTLYDNKSKKWAVETNNPNYNDGKVNVKQHTRQVNGKIVNVKAHTKKIERVVFSTKKKIGYDKMNKRPVYIEAEIKEYKGQDKKGIDGKPISNYKTFSTSASSVNFGGQAYDTISNPNEVQLTNISKKDLDRYVELWKEKHLNDLNDATRKQQAIIKQGQKEKKIPKDTWNYNASVAYLKSKNAYNDGGYKYGSAWLVRNLGEKEEKEIKEILNRIK